MIRVRIDDPAIPIPQELWEMLQELGRRRGRGWLLRKPHGEDEYRWIAFVQRETDIDVVGLECLSSVPVNGSLSEEKYYCSWVRKTREVAKAIWNEWIKDEAVVAALTEAAAQGRRSL